MIWKKNLTKKKEENKNKMFFITIVKKIIQHRRRFFLLSAAVFLMVFSLSAGAIWVEKGSFQKKNIDFETRPEIFRIRFEKTPGRIDKTIQVVNLSKEEKEFFILTKDLKTGEECGRSAFSIDENEKEVSGWIKPEIDRFSLKAGEAQYVGVEVLVPQGKNSGDYYGIVLVGSRTYQKRAVEESKEKEKIKEVPVIESRGVPFYVTVGRKTGNERMILEKFQTTKKWYDRRPLEFELTFKNDSDFSLIPVYKIEIYNLWGKMVGLAPPETIEVLKKSSRTEKLLWDYQNFLVGPYKAKIILDENGKTFWKETVFYVFPWREFSLGFLIIFLVLLEINFLRKRKKY